jgi:hypothetical protein
MQTKLPRIDIREEVSTQQGNQQQARQTEEKETGDEDPSLFQAPIKKTGVPITKSFKSVFKPLMKTGKATECAPGLTMLFNLLGE